MYLQLVSNIPTRGVSVIVIVFIIVFLLIPQAREALNLFLMRFGGLISFFYFVLNQQSAELDLFSRLYQDFNERYDKLNGDLNRIYIDDSDNELKGQISTCFLTTSIFAASKVSLLH